MIRRLFNIASLVSLLLGALTLALWIPSYRVAIRHSMPFGLEFRYSRGELGFSWYYTVPAGLVVAFFFMLPLAWLLVRDWRSAHPLPQSGRCSACAYDLRASTDRCPECGTPIHADAKI